MIAAYLRGIETKVNESLNKVGQEIAAYLRGIETLQSNELDD